MLQEFRKYPRAEAGIHIQVGFHFGGHRFTGLPVTMLGAGGCGFQAPEAMLQLMDVLERSTLLDHLVLEHPMLPHQPVQARIAYTTGHDPVSIGLEFVELPSDFQERLSHLVQSLMHPALHA